MGQQGDRCRGRFQESDHDYHPWAWVDAQELPVAATGGQQRVWQRQENRAVVGAGKLAAGRDASADPEAGAKAAQPDVAHRKPEEQQKGQRAWAEEERWPLVPRVPEQLVSPRQVRGRRQAGARQAAAAQERIRADARREERKAWGPQEQLGSRARQAWQRLAQEREERREREEPREGPAVAEEQREQAPVPACPGVAGEPSQRYPRG